MSALIVLTALLVAPVNVLDAEARSTTGKSVVDQVSTTYAEEPSYSVPATFIGPPVAPPRREPDTPGTLAACFGLLVYLGYRRGKALGAAF